MSRFTSSKLIGSVWIAATLVVGGCAETDAVDGEEGGGEITGTALPVTVSTVSGAGGAETTSGGGDGGAGAGTSSSATVSSATSTSATTASGTTSATTTTTGGGPECDFSLTNACASGEILTAVSGDEGFDTRVVQGTAGRWYHVYVDESSSGILPLDYTVTLENAPGMNYDLVVYTGNGSMPNCGAPQQLGAGNPEAVTISMTDYVGSDQGHWISVLVHHNGGSGCEADDAFTLTVQGNFHFSCQNNGTCTTADACVCADCDQDTYCQGPQACQNDGVCDAYYEGCSCDDCEDVPQCG